MFSRRFFPVVLGLALACVVSSSSRAMAKERTSFDDSTASPRGNYPVKNGSKVTVTAVLKAGSKGVARVPINVYINGNPTPYKVKTDGNGRFSLTTTVSVPGPIPPAGKNVVWCAEFPGDSSYAGASTCNYIHGWRFTVMP